MRRFQHASRVFVVVLLLFLSVSWYIIDVFSLPELRFSTSACRPAIMTTAYSPPSVSGSNAASPEDLLRYLQSADRASPNSTIILVTDSTASTQTICAMSARAHGWMIVYNTAELAALMPDVARDLHVYSARWWLWSLVLRDIAAAFSWYGHTPDLRFVVPPGFRFAEVAPYLCNAALVAPVAVTRYPPCVSEILLSDSRDVVFQSDPFLSTIARPSPSPSKDGYTAGKPTLYISGEPRGRTIGTCKFNSEWIYKMFGQVAFNVMYNNTIRCAGLLFGSVEAISLLIDVGMIPAISAYSKTVWMDQGVLNFITSFNFPEVWDVRLIADNVTARGTEIARHVASRINVVVVPTESGWLCTVYQYAFVEGGVPQAPDGAVTGVRNTMTGAAAPCAVVHQFDRFPQLVAYVRSRWNASLADSPAID